MPQKTDPARRPSYCGTTAYKLANMAESLGQLAEAGGFAGAAMSLAERASPQSALAVAGVGGFAQTAAAGVKWLSGDTSYKGKFIFGALGGYAVKALVPEQIKSKIADALSDKGMGSIVDAVSQESQCARFAK